MSSKAKPPPISTSKSITTPSSFLPLPPALRNNRSFAQLTRLLGISAPTEANDSGSDADDDDDEDRTLSNSGDDEGDTHSDVDEESLMWDAQTALIAHQPALAAKYYATAALPPYCSSAACLALGNLLARGSGLSQQEPEPSPSTPFQSTSPRSPQASWFQSFFRTAEPLALPQTPTLESPIVERRPSNGWSLPTEGKRVVRDVAGLGKAGGWLILGMGWIIDAEAARTHTHKGARQIQPSTRKTSHDGEDDDDDDDIIVFKHKGKGRAQPIPYEPTSASTVSSKDSFSTLDDDADSEGAKIKLLYNLILPLLHMYRYGHIQHHDPVSLPPLAPSQLPHVLRPQGDNEKGRNVWSLGSTVVAKVLEMPLLSATGLNKEESMKRDGIVMVCNYIRGVTSSPNVAEAAFKTILRQGPCGLEIVDDLLRQAFRRLNTILKSTGGSPISPSELEGYPFPLVSAAPSRLVARKQSTTSLLSLADSMMSASLRMMPVKSTASLASLACDQQMAEPHSATDGVATRSLRSIQRHQRRTAIQQHAAATTPSHTWWPSLHSWNIPRASSQLTPVQQESVQEEEHAKRQPVPKSATPVSASKERRTSVIRAVASSPQLTTHRRLPFEPTHAVAAIDPELAALELASALTKHVTCSVCNAGGVNFPNCRKCGLTFCSRKCRVDENGAGNGKKHICGLWEARCHPPPPLSGAGAAAASAATTPVATPAPIAAVSAASAVHSAPVPVAAI